MMGLKELSCLHSCLMPSVTLHMRKMNENRTIQLFQCKFTNWYCRSRKASEQHISLWRSCACAVSHSFLGRTLSWICKSLAQGLRYSTVQSCPGSGRHCLYAADLEGQEVLVITLVLPEVGSSRSAHMSSSQPDTSCLRGDDI